MKYGIIGCGKMGTIILEVLLKKFVSRNDKVIVSDIEKEVLSFIEKNFNVKTTNSNIELVKFAETVILAIKPQQFKSVLQEISPYVNKDKFIISIAAGISINLIENFLSKKVPIARCMPNLPLKYGFGLTAVCYNKNVRLFQKEFIKKLFSSGGKVIEISESQFDSLTAISGSGPAYIFYISEILQKISQKFGFDRNISKILVNQTVLGAAEMLNLSSMSAKELKESVTSKGGTTEEALKIFYQNNLEKIFYKALKKAQLRAKELSKILKYS